MTGEIEAAGGLVAGGVFARAVEPAHGERGHGPGGLCLNCGTRRVGDFCHACGQSGHVHRSIGAIGHDIAHAVLHFEGKAWRTLPMLVLHPGQLTRRYIAGERARFVSPMALFLFSVFLMFAVVANLPLFSFGDAFLRGDIQGGVAEARVKLGEERGRAAAGLVETRAELAAERAEARPEAARVARLERKLATDAKAARELAAAEAAIGPIATFGVAGTPSPTADNWLDAKFRKAKANPQLLLYKLQNSAYKFSWALIPISLPFVWLLFPLRRDVGFYDHAVFATYSLTFISLFAILLAILGALGVAWQALFFAALLVPPFHIYKQLKYGYCLSRGGALWRTGWMLVFAFATVMLFASLLVYLGVAD